MAEQFNIEQYRQQMSGQVPAQQQQPQQQMMGQPQPQPYFAPPQQPQQQMVPQQHVPQQMAANPVAPQHHTSPPQAQGQIQIQTQGQASHMPPHMAQAGQAQPQAWLPPVQNQMPQTAPHQAHPPAHIQHMNQIPQTPVFTPPPNFAPAPETAPQQQLQEAGKKSFFKMKLGSKIKLPKIKPATAETANSVHTTKTPPAKIFLFGMASGIVCFLIGSMLLSSLLSDNSAQSFSEIERQNARAEQPVLPQGVQPTTPPARETVVEVMTP